MARTTKMSLLVVLLAFPAGFALAVALNNGF